MVKIISRDTMLNQRRTQTTEENVVYTLGGEMKSVVKKIANGNVTTLTLNKPLGEMITSSAVAPELMEKIVLDVELGREQVPLLYGLIYDRMENANFPEVFDAKWVQYGVVMFAQITEGGEIDFGHLKAEQGPIARIFTYGAGFEYTEDMVEYNKTWEMEAYDRAFGEGHNALLNHLHLYPIISAKHKAENKTAAQGADADPIELKYKKTIKKALEDAAKAKRPGTILLASEANKYTIEDSLKKMTINGTDHAEISSISAIIYYDGWEVTVGKKTKGYNGVPDGKAYLIRPKRGFKELIKHTLRVDSQGSDLSRLIEQQIVGRLRRGVFAAIDENVQEITLPS